MCDFSGKLVAWMDGELEPKDAAAVKDHVEICAECRSNVNAYRQASDELNAYFNETPAAEAQEWPVRAVVLASATGALAALLGLLLLWPRMQTQPQRFAVAAAPATASAESTSVAQSSISSALRPNEGSMERVRRRPVTGAENGPAQIRQQHSSLPEKTEVTAYELPNEAVVEIAIPADDMFPPGAVPAGMNFVADMTIAADGSAERLQVRPRLAGFERSSTHP
jgi:anti-sigma factor RsiW